MPIIFALTCSTCGHRAQASSTGLVVMDDGHEEILGHPAESGRAKRLTGQSLDDLLSAGRINYAYHLVCEGCGSVCLYRRSDLGLQTQAGDRATYVRQLVYQPSDEDVVGAWCKVCGRHQLRGMAELEGLICPKCGNRTQSMKVSGIS